MAAPGPTPIKVVAALLAAAALAAPFVASNEGRPPKVYLDTGNVATGGYGHTGPDVPAVGTPVSDEQATQWLAEDLVKHGVKIARCVDPAVIVSMPSFSLSAFQDISLNIGTGAFCKSKMAKSLNVGDVRGACAHMSDWIYDNGKVVHGLVLRRERERARCEQELPK